MGTLRRQSLLCRHGYGVPSWTLCVSSVARRRPREACSAISVGGRHAVSLKLRTETPPAAWHQTGAGRDPMDPAERREPPPGRYVAI
jgi:hypothetical protein